MLRERASLQPNETAFTYVDYEQDWAGVAESLTWSQLYRRTSNVAQELRACGSTGDRAVILAPQGLDYVVAFLGALQAGMIAVPLSVPLGGASDERVSAVLRDASPSAILTTSSVAGNVAEHIQLKPGESAPSIIELDLLDLDSQNGPAAEVDSRPEHRVFAIHLRVDPYASGSHDLAQKHSGQCRTDHGRVLRRQRRALLPPDTTMVSWLPFFHDMGLVLGIIMPVLCGSSRCAHEPGGVPAAAGAVDAIAGKQQSRVYRSAERWLSNWRHEKHQMTTWPGLTSAACTTSSVVPNAYNPRRSSASLSDSPASIFSPGCYGPHMGSRKPRCTWRPANAGQPPVTVLFRIRGTDRRPREAVRKRRRYTAGQLRRAAVADGAHRRPRNQYRVSGGNGR